ncbi:MAG: SH3 domain-containing protein, partial [Hyphomonas sp.]
LGWAVAPDGDWENFINLGVARVPAGAVVSLETCEEALCQVRIGRYRGWAPRDQLWGASVTNG